MASGFLSNIINPKVLVFYLAVLPQLLGPQAPLRSLLALALSHAALSLRYLPVHVSGFDRARRVLTRRPVRRALDALTGAALLGFGAKLAIASRWRAPHAPVSLDLPPCAATLCTAMAE